MEKKILMLMVEDFIEVNRSKGVEVYPVHSMETIEDFRKDALATLYGKVENYRSFGMLCDFNFEDEWFINNNNIVSSLSQKALEEKLLTEEDSIINLYLDIEKEYPEELMNKNEIVTEMLRKYVFPIDQSDLEESYHTVYQDAGLDSIAEALSEVTIKDLMRQLQNASSGGWAVAKNDGQYYLLEC